MKKLFIVLGSILVILIGIVGIIEAFYLFYGRPLDEASLAYTRVAIPAICSPWNEKELLARASPEFKAAVTTDQLDRIFRWFSTLGPMLKFDPPAGQSMIAFTPRTGTKITGQYTVKAEFDKGSGTITIGLIKHGDQWQIFGFNVQSLQLAPH